MSSSTISPGRLAELSKNGKKLELIDVRTPVEFREVHVEFARNVPLDKLDPPAIMNTRSHSAHEPLYIVCHSGSRGQQACDKFSKAGFSNVVNIEGGTVACVNAGLRSSAARRQSRSNDKYGLFAGSIVLVGVLLAQFVNPYFMWLSGFIGAGLLFAGVTDTCGMGMMLARMPWNRCSN